MNKQIYTFAWTFNSLDSLTHFPYLEYGLSCVEVLVSKYNYFPYFKRITTMLYPSMHLYAFPFLIQHALFRRVGKFTISNLKLSFTVYMPSPMFMLLQLTSWKQNYKNHSQFLGSSSISTAYEIWFYHSFFKIRFRTHPIQMSFLSFSSFCLNFFLHISFVLLFSFFSSFSHVFSWNIYANLVKTAFHPPPRHFMSISWPAWRPSIQLLSLNVHLAYSISHIFLASSSPRLMFL